MLEKKEQWKDEKRLRRVRESPRPEEIVEEIEEEKEIRPENSVQVCNKPGCKCFGFYSDKLGDGEWDQTKIIIFCNDREYDHYDANELRKLAERAVGGYKKRKELIQSTYAKDRYGQIELTCRSHQAAVQALWNAYHARMSFGIGVNWYYRRTRHYDHEEEEEHEEQEHDK
jgi:hypothetical protein